MNSDISKTFMSHVLILKFTEKLDLRRGEKRVLLYQILAFITNGKA